MELQSKRHYTDVSKGLGAPFGGYGTGYFVYGRHGFVNWNVDGFPELQQTQEYPNTKLWKYNEENPIEAPIALTLKKNGKMSLFQTRFSGFTEGQPCTDFNMSVFMPFGHVTLTLDEDVHAEMLMYSSAKPHDIARTGIPACVFEIALRNTSDQDCEYTLSMAYRSDLFTASRQGELLILSEESGQTAFGIAGGQGGEITLYVEVGQQISVIAALGWYYPTFSTPGLAENDVIFRNNKIQDYNYEKNQGQYIRNYALRYSSAADAAKEALKNHELWKSDIQQWHNSFQVPEEILHIWFGSYASVITATLHTVDGFCFEIEQPHGCLNTMDVCVYSNWLYMINWPEIERQDLKMYVAAIPTTGETAGKVWHSLWADGAHYVEESTYVIRVWRYTLWSRDREFLREAFPSVKLAMEYAYRTSGRGSLLNNVGGNQSYDGLMMPGIGVYINVQWIFALFAYRKMCLVLGEKCELANRKLEAFLADAIKEYNEVLWDEEGGYWHIYQTNETSLQQPFGSAVFTDQLFGHWIAGIDTDSRDVLGVEKEKSAVSKIYHHNRVEEEQSGYSCWANGMMPQREESYRIDVTDENPAVCGFHALTCWISTQLNFASMLGYFGMETESLDVFTQVAKGIGHNVIAAGEWNRMVDKDLKPVSCWREIGKDTPRFPPYPRYKSSWEYLVCLLGAEMTLDTISLKPFKTISFCLKHVEIGGVTMTVSVEEGWTHCLINGEAGFPCISRDVTQVSFEFVR